MLSTNIKFDTKWWDKFLQETNQMTKSTVLKDCISAEEVSDIKHRILEIILDLSHLRTIEYGYRVFIDNHKLDENEMKTIYDNPPNKDDSLETWCDRLFKEKEFGVIINSGERFNDGLSNLLARKSKPLFEKLGFPIEGINFTLFIGNYSSTPIGIHQDMPGENVIHYHLGPGKKTMFTWDEKLYKELQKKYNSLEIDRFLPYGKEYTFEQGDLYFMPQGVYHIGKQESFSIALTFWFYNHSKVRIAEKLNSMLFEQYINKNNDELLPPDVNELNDLSNIDNILTIYEFPEDIKKLSFRDLLQETYKDLKYTIASNAGYRNTLLPKVNDYELKLNDTVIIEDPYKILYTESYNKNNLYVYVRGIKLSFNNFANIKQIVSIINEQNPIQINEFSKKLEEIWDNHLIIYVLSLFFKYKGIRLV